MAKRSTEISVDTPNRASSLKNVLVTASKDSILGRGSYGTVIKAVYKGQQVAVKILNDCVTTKIASIKNESNVLGWKHENIIQILEIDCNYDYGIVIMERFPGQCLQSILDKCKIRLYHKLLISLDILSGLSYCHRNNVIHLDIKPQNILVALAMISKCKQHEKTYICKLCDFGSSLKLGEYYKPSEHAGTVRYMSPETLQKFEVSPASDIFSLGITMWQIETSKYPYAVFKHNEIVAYKVVKEGLRPDVQNYANPMSSYLTPTQHCRCFCNHYSNELSSNSVENVMKVIRSPKSAQLSCLTKRIGKENQFGSLNTKINLEPKCKTIDTLISPFKLNNRNAIRNVTSRKIFDTPTIKITNVCNKEVNSEHSESEFNLKVLFSEPNNLKTISLNCGEEIYRTLYKKCWNTDPKKRPTLKILKMELLTALRNIS